MTPLLTPDLNKIRVGEMKYIAQRYERYAHERKKSQVVDVFGEPGQGRIPSQVGGQYMRFVLQGPEHSYFVVGLRPIPRSGRCCVKSGKPFFYL